MRLWAYGPVDAPAGVAICDAGRVLPASDIQRYTHNDVRGCLSCFADFFRYNLLRQEEGWWFDADVLCLRRVDDFGFPGLQVFGFQDQGVAVGALRLTPDFADKLVARANRFALEKDNHFRWGDLGPDLLQEVAAAEGILASGQPTSVFYPIHWHDALMALDPARRQEAEAACRDAHTYHFWNEIVRRHAIPKALMPPQGSFLHERFLAVDAGLAHLPTLPLSTFHRLAVPLSAGDTGFSQHLRALGPALARAIRRRLGCGSAVS